MLTGSINFDVTLAIDLGDIIEFVLLVAAFIAIYQTHKSIKNTTIDAEKNYQLSVESLKLAKLDSERNLEQAMNALAEAEKQRKIDETPILLLSTPEEIILTRFDLTNMLINGFSSDFIKSTRFTVENVGKNVAVNVIASQWSVLDDSDFSLGFYLFEIQDKQKFIEDERIVDKLEFLSIDYRLNRPVLLNFNINYIYAMLMRAKRHIETEDKLSYSLKSEQVSIDLEWSNTSDEISNYSTYLIHFVCDITPTDVTVKTVINDYSFDKF